MNKSFLVLSVMLIKAFGMNSLQAREKSSYGSNYKRTVSEISRIRLYMNMYGLDLGMKYHIPKRDKNNAIFQK